MVPRPYKSPVMSQGASGDYEFTVKNPARPAQEEVRIRVPAGATVRDVKLRLQAAYPGNPEPATVTVRHEEAGRG